MSIPWHGPLGPPGLNLFWNGHSSPRPNALFCNLLLQSCYKPLQTVTSCYNTAFY